MTEKINEHARAVTQRDIAKKLGLDHSTVSLALRDSPKISKTRREKVIQVAQEMGYELNAAASALARFKRISSQTPIHAALAWLNSWDKPAELLKLNEFKLYWDGVGETASRLGYNLEEIILSEKLSPSRAQHILETRGIQAILIPPHGSRSSTFRQFDWSRFTALRFGRSVPYPAVNLVTADHVANAMLAYNEVRLRGYQRIGMVDSSLDKEWFFFDAGYMKAQQYSPKGQQLSILRLKEQDVKNQKLFEKWLQKEKPDAIITSLVTVPEMLTQAGYRIPDDIALAAMSVLDGHISSGIYQNSKEIGRVAALNLIAQIQDNQRGIPDLHRETLVRGHWVEGDTCPRR